MRKVRIPHRPKKKSTEMLVFLRPYLENYGFLNRRIFSIKLCFDSILNRFSNA